MDTPGIEPAVAGVHLVVDRTPRPPGPGNAELREAAAGRAAESRPAESAPPLDPRYADSDDDEEMMPRPNERDWGVPPFEPLHIRTGDFDGVPLLDGPMMVHMDPPPAGEAAPVAAPVAAPAQEPASPPVLKAAPALQPAPSKAAPAAAPVPRTAGVVGDNSDRFAAVAPPPRNAAELQRIVTIRVCNLGEARWSGAQLMAALELHGLAFGRYQVFHRKHADGRSLFCVASLIEPGTFDIAAMAEQEFRGVTLFAVLPGPIPPLETMDELLGTARGLAEELSGMVQDAKGIPLSPQRAAALREDVARFQAQLPVH